jgi:hypothetical protein
MSRCRDGSRASADARYFAGSLASTWPPSLCRIVERIFSAKGCSRGERKRVYSAEAIWFA